MSNTENFWPDFQADKIISPKTILKEQGALLGEKTGNLVFGEVRTGSSNDGRIVQYFDIVAPTLNNYRFSLFNVRHGAIYYPLEIYYKTRIVVDNEIVFKDMLKDIFKDEKTVKIITSLMGQSMEQS